MQEHADFKVQEHDDHYRIECASDDQQTHLLVEGHLADKLPKTSVFRSISEASQFFERGSLGYSVTHQEGQYDALELHSFNWRVRPLDVENVKSSFFDNPELFPVGSVDFDSALLMEGIEHEWHGGNRLSSGSPCG